MSNIPTAEEFRLEQNLLPDLSPLKCLDGIMLNGNERIEKLMVEFAKLHVEAALKEVSEKAELEKLAPWEEDDGLLRDIDKGSILNAYSLKNIK